MDNNLNLSSNMSSVKNYENIVSKRKASILKKREMKEQKKGIFHAKNEDKYILAAGNAYAEENVKINDKFKLTVVESERERKKGEKHLNKEAINGMFQIKTFDDESLLNESYLKHILGESYYTPNYNYIKMMLRNIFTKEITSNSKNLKISHNT